MSIDKANNGCKKNVKIYELTSCFSSAVLFWSILTLFYSYRGLSFFEIALLQSVGSIVTAVLEIPTGWIGDRFGHNKILRIGVISKVVAVLLLTIANNIWLFLLSEICFSLATASQSGADSALLFESLKAVQKESDYKDILAKVRGRQALIRFAIRLLTPILYGIKPEWPFVLSAFILIVVVILTYQYAKVEIVDDAIANTEPSNTEASNLTKKIKASIINIVSNKAFLICCLLSSVLLVSVSNYAQYIGTYLQSLGLDIKYLGIITASASIGEFFGAKIAKSIGSEKTNIALIILAICIAGIVFVIGKFDIIIGAAIGYFVINTLHTSYGILLNDRFQSVIDSNNRATMLSISNQVDEVASVVTDPIIGVAIDGLGFGLAYQIIGGITLILIISIGVSINGTLRRVRTN